LGWTRDKRAFRPLINKLLDQNEHPQVRADIAEALANIGIKEAVPVLITLLEESSPEIRFWSAYALGQLGDPSAIPSLEKLAGDDIEVPGWWSVGKEASNAIEALRGQINTDPNK
jgi:HEAT repeat protein